MLTLVKGCMFCYVAVNTDLYLQFSQRSDKFKCKNNFKNRE